METKVFVENVSLFEILNSINSGIYEINDISNVRILCKIKPGFEIINTESDISEDIKDYCSNLKINNTSNVETTYIDFVVINRINDNIKLMSLLELIVSSKYLNIDETDKWDLDKPEFDCIELNYNEDDRENVILDNLNKLTDMKIIG